MTQDHSAALALVSVHRKKPASVTTDKDELEQSKNIEEDPDLQRAADLVTLHHDVKMKHVQGEDAGLKQARRDVDRVLERLEGKSFGK